MYKLYFYLYFFLLILVFFISCKGDKIPDLPLEHFEQIVPRKLTVTGYIDLEKYDIYKPGTAIKHKNGYVIQDLTNKNLISYISLSDNSVIRGIDKGEGPEEIISAGKLQRMNDDFFIYDIMRKQVFKVNLDIDTRKIFLSEHKKIHAPGRLFSTCVLSGGIISAGILENGWLESYNNEDSLISFISYPDFEETKELTLIEKGAIYLASSIVPSPDYSKIACVPQGAGVISFARLNGNKLEEYKRLMYNPPLVTAPRTAGSTAIVYSQDAMTAFLDLVCEDDFVMALYSGRTSESHGATESAYCEHILVYDWEGNPIKHFILEKPLMSLGYDKGNKILYGIGYDPEGMIIEYDLNDKNQYNL